MRSIVLPAVLAGLSVAGLALLALSAATADDVTSIGVVKNDKGKFVFTNPNVQIKEGDTVRWVVVDEVGTHQLVPDTDQDAMQDTGAFDASAPVAQAFAKAGIINYHCTVHPKSMRGSITVTAAATPEKSVEAPATEAAPQRTQTQPKKATKPSSGYGGYGGYSY